MTEENKKLLANLEYQLRKLMETNNKTKAENAALQQLLGERNEEIKELKNNLEILNANYTNLKQARIISINDNEVRDTKQRLSKLVREVDKCIAMLNE